MVQLSFCSADTGVKVDEHLWEASTERLNVRETCSEDKVPAVNPGNDSAASFTCPELPLDLQQFPKPRRVQLCMSYLLPLKKMVFCTITISQGIGKHIQMHDLSFWMLLSLYFILS